MPSWDASPYLVALIVTAAVSFMLALYGWGRRTDRAGAYFALLMLVVAEWAFTQAMEHAVSGLSVKILFAKFQYIAVVSVAPLWLLFALSFGKLESSLTRLQRVLIWVFPGIILALAATNELHGLVWPEIAPVSSDPGSPLVYAHGPAVWANAAFSYSLVALATILIVRTAARAPKVFRRQAVILVIGAAIPWAGNILYMSGGGPFRGLDLTPTAFMISGLLVTWSIFRFQFLALIPIAHETLFAGITDGVIALDAEDRIIDINKAAVRIAGFAADPVGRKADEAFAAWPQFLDLFRECSEIQTEISVASGDHPAWIDVRVFPVDSRQGHRHGRVLVLRDITKRKLAEAALRESEGKYRELYDFLPIPVYEMDFEANITAANQAIYDAFGGTPDVFRRGLKAWQLLSPEDVAKSAANIQRLLAGERLPGTEYNIRRLDGTTFPAIIISSVIYQDGKPEGLRGAIIDITERRRYEKALQETLDNLQKAVGATIQAMVSAVEARDPYTAGHQLRVAELAQAIAVEMGLPQ